MTEQSMFFSDGSYYSQNVFARFIKDIFGHDGVVTGIDNELEVTANTPTNMAVNVNTGRSYIKGYFHEILTDAVSLTIPDADETNDRIDRIILRLDVDSERKISACVLEGTPAASPVAPTLTQTSTIWEISLAQVYVSANATSIATSNITDERPYMWFNRDNTPKATTSELGSIKVGYGLTVTDGVLAVSNAPVKVNVATTGVTPIGTLSAPVITPSDTTSHTTSSTSEVVLASGISLSLSGESETLYQGFTLNQRTGNPAYKTKMTVVVYSNTTNVTVTAYGKIYRDSDSSLIGSASKVTTSSGTYSVTTEISLPSDFDLSTETVTIKGYVTNTSSTVGSTYTSTVTLYAWTGTESTLYLHA